MRRLLFTMAGAMVAMVALSFAACQKTQSAPAQPASGAPLAHAVAAPAPYVPVAAYDIKRDPAADLQSAIGEARRTNRKILLEVGGDWCKWCHIMDGYFDAHRDLLDLREQKFITVKVNYSEENKNDTFLSKYPKIPGYPHLFVLDADGKLLQSQDTSALEDGQSYNHDKFADFLTKWGASSANGMKGMPCR